MRSALVQAVHHARHRSAFGRPLVDQPLMRNVLADLAVESEAATTAMMRLAGANDRAVRGDEGEAALRRHRAGGHQVPGVQAGADGRRRGARVPRRQRLHRGLRPAPDLPRGAADVDLGGVGQRRRARRAARDGPRAAHARRATSPRSSRPTAPTPGSTTPSAGSRRSSPSFDDLEQRARRVVEQLALVFQGSLLVRHAPAAVADAFCASRLGGDWGARLRHAAARARPGRRAGARDACLRRHPRCAATKRMVDLPWSEP